MILTAICVGKSQPSTVKSGRTGYFKTSVGGPVSITPAGVSGDFIADTDNHGGIDQAVYLFGGTDRAWWEDKLGKPCPPGFFGENLCISDLESARLCLGDVLDIGRARLQITSPRIPCVTYHTVMNDKSAMKDFFAAERPGAYARVLTPGTVQAGDAVRHHAYDGDRITIIDNLRAYQANFVDHQFLRRALTVPAHHKLHDLARETLA